MGAHSACKTNSQNTQHPASACSRCDEVVRCNDVTHARAPQNVHAEFDSSMEAEESFEVAARYDPLPEGPACEEGTVRSLHEPECMKVEFD